MRIAKIVVLGILCLIISDGSLLQKALADIYTYTDEKGVIHFSNVPTSPKYRLKIRETHFNYQRLSSGSYDKIINDICKKHNVDPLLVKAVIKAESDFNPQAVSTKGATGLMQLMPETADNMGVNNIYDPENNIEGGVKYLKRLAGIFKDDLKLVVAAYNAGENAVIKYKKTVPPFKETREYVKRVLQYLKEYKQTNYAANISNGAKESNIELAKE